MGLVFGNIPPAAVLLAVFIVVVVVVFGAVPKLSANYIIIFKRSKTKIFKPANFRATGDA